MLRKKIALLVMLLTLLVSLALPGAAGACSGDDCGCGIAAQECRDSCGGVPACIRQCTHESIACAKACCTPF